MFKLVVLSAIFAVAVAMPSGVHLGAPLLTKTIAINAPIIKSAIITEPAHVEIREPYLAKVGERIDSVPSAVSHQSSTVVHSRAEKVTPILAEGVKSYIAPAVRTIETPVLSAYAAPAAIHAYAAPAAIHSYAAPAAIHSYAAPAAITAYAGPALRTVEHGPVLAKSIHHAPLLVKSVHSAPLLRSW